MVDFFGLSFYVHYSVIAFNVSLEDDDLINLNQLFSSLIFLGFFPISPYFA